MSARSGRATSDYSRGPMRSIASLSPTSIARFALAIVGLAGCVMLVLATTATVFKVTVVTTSELQAPIDTVQTGSERHGVALVLLAVFAAVMIVGALRGAKPAMLAVAAAGLAAVLIALVQDANALDDVVAEVGVLYEGASGSRESGYYLETLGGALLLVSGGLSFLLAVFARTPPETAVREASEPEPRAKSDDWFGEAGS